MVPWKEPVSWPFPMLETQSGIMMALATVLGPLRVYPMMIPSPSTGCPYVFPQLSQQLRVKETKTQRRHSQ